MVIAYEPLWAIGTGQAATPEDAQDACQWIREVVGRCGGRRGRGQVRIQYGGSVNEDNTEDLLRLPGRRRRCWWAGPASTPAPSSGSSGPRPGPFAEFGSVSIGPEPRRGSPVLTAIIVVLQILACLALIFLILMHSGKGGGLSDMFGGSVGSAAAGSTVVEKNLDRITVTVAVIFAFTNLILILRLQ